MFAYDMFKFKGLWTSKRALCFRTGHSLQMGKGPFLTQESHMCNTSYRELWENVSQIRYTPAYY